MIFRAVKRVLLLGLVLSFSSMAAESLVSSSSALSQSAATLDKQSLSSATLEKPSSSVQPSSSASAPAKPLPKWQTLPEISAPWMKGERLEYELSWGFISAGALLRQAMRRLKSKRVMMENPKFTLMRPPTRPSISSTRFMILFLHLFAIKVS